MDERAINAIHRLPREDLESFALRAAVQVRANRQELESGRFFLALLIGFVLGALVASAGFVVGSSLG